MYGQTDKQGDSYIPQKLAVGLKFQLVEALDCPKP